MTSLGPTWATATGWETVEDWMGARLSSRWSAAEGADFDQAGLSVEVREAANDNLPAGWTLANNQFVGPTPIPEDALNIIRDTVEEIDFWGVAQFYDNGDLREEDHRLRRVTSDTWGGTSAGHVLVVRESPDQRGGVTGQWLDPVV